jgi:hypothetical protein
MQKRATAGQLRVSHTHHRQGSCIMTRPSILTVIAFAALGSSCLVSTDASAFCHWIGGRYHSPRPAAGQPAKQRSFAAIGHHQTHQAASNPHTSGDGGHADKAPASSAEVTAALACGASCVTEPDRAPVQHGDDGSAGGASKTSGVAVSVDKSAADRTSGVAAGADRSDADKTNGLAVSSDGNGVTVIGGKWTGIGARDDAEDTRFRAIALSLSDDGAWVVRTAPTLATAGAGALRACGEQFRQCTLSDAQVAPTAFGCLVVIQSDDASRVFAAAGDSSDLARAAAAAQIANTGLRGQIVFTGCNS